MGENTESGKRKRYSVIKSPWMLGGITLFIFGLGGVLIIEFIQGKNIWQVLGAGEAVYFQLVAGSVYGLLGYLVAWWMITRKFFAKERQYYYGLISRWNLRLGPMVFISVCAGIGEELFFRGGIQPLIGNWLTSVLFVLLHGYLNPRNWRICVYGLVMVGIIFGIGYLFETIGIVSAMAAHAVFDLLLFLYITKKGP